MQVRETLAKTGMTFTNMFKQKSVDTILSSITNAIHELDMLAESKAKEAENIQFKIADLAAERNAATKEADRAQAVCIKLEKLVA